MYLRPDGRRVKHEFRGWLELLIIVFALQMMAVSIRTDELGVERPIIFEEVLMILLSLFLFEESMVKEQAAQYMILDSMILLYKRKELEFTYNQKSLLNVYECPWHDGQNLVCYLRSYPKLSAISTDCPLMDIGQWEVENVCRVSKNNSFVLITLRRRWR